jgi:ADP-dependent NAD(P)H-hydrate dehydratase / NAD(P)H-hydrate epimerase
VVSAAESAARDRAAIDDGIPSRALMRAAGRAAAAEIARRFETRLAGGIAVFAGPGNNGGDGWVVAGALAAGGVPVRVTAVGESRTDDATAERAAAEAVGVIGPVLGSEALIVDALLGTGASGAPRGPIADAIARMMAARQRGAVVVALDVPSGVDATTGSATGAVQADVTLTFATLKRGLAVARGTAGTIAVLDIGLGRHADLADNAPMLVDAAFVRARVPRLQADANKGTRRRIAIVAGGAGMAGAAILAARAAHASGVGLVRLFVSASNVPVVQAAAYEALGYPWPANDEIARRDIGEWAHAVLLGPGLGATSETRVVVERVLRASRVPVVIDADGLNVFAGSVAALGALLAHRPAILTPHPGEFSRLTGATLDSVLAQRFDVGAGLAAQLDATVLLKGVPTVVSAPGGARVVSAAGSPVLATGGSGDLLSGIVTTLLAQTGDAPASAACGAWVHGRAAELAGAGRVRGITLDDVVHALPAAWQARSPVPRYPVLAELPAVGERP